MSVDVIIPTYRPQKDILKLISRLMAQTIVPNRIILMNTDEKLFDVFNQQYKLVEKYPTVEVYHVDKKEFDHGKTRHEGILKSNSDFCLMMTQDALPLNKYLIEKLIKAFNIENVVVAYGRQLAKKNSDQIEKFLRNYNYSTKSIVKSKEDLPQMGIKTYFSSNVCAMYKREYYHQIEGFSYPTIFNEDLFFGAKAIQAGYKISYVATAEVIHSHQYTCWQQFQRNFDNGVSQAQYKHLLKEISSESEGINFVKQGAKYLYNHNQIWLLPYFIIQTGFKFIGFKFGKYYHILPKKLILICTSNEQYW